MNQLNSKKYEFLVWGDVVAFSKWANNQGQEVKVKLLSKKESLMTPHIAEATDLNALENLGAMEDVAWRYAQGSNLGSTDVQVIVNGKKMLAWSEYHNKGYRYKDLEDFMTNGQPASVERNIAAVLASLASENNLSISEFIQKYSS